MLDVIALAQQCAPQIHPDTMERLVRTESDFNPFAIGVVRATLHRQPQSLDEAISTTQWLEQHGYQYSVGLAQIFKGNFKKYDLTVQSAFDVCTNLRTSAAILSDCYLRSRNSQKSNNTPQIALREAFSCYNSGNFSSGFKNGYVERVITANGVNIPLGVHPTKTSPLIKEEPPPPQNKTLTSAIRF
jgi:type IV secretion system protein VirB1